MLTRHLLALQQLTHVGFPKVGAKTVRHLHAQLTASPQPSDIADQVLAAYEQVRQTPRNGHLLPLDHAGWQRALDQADELLAACSQQGILALGRDETTYPTRLAQLADAPTVLFVKGNPSALTAPAVAIIGTREPSAYGRTAGYQLARSLTEAGLAIISGLAIGCDTLAHRACLDAGGQTVAVLAGGLDHIYPKENNALAAEILAAGGCLVAEHPVGVRPRSNYFVERDRLQSGLADAVVVLETDVKGGTMHTVGFAEKQGRLVACLLHTGSHADHPKAQGNQLLLREQRALPLGDDQAEIREVLRRLGHRAHVAN